MTDGLQRRLTVLFCRECERYLQPPNSWIRANLESRELLTFCLKRIKNLSKLKLVDAGFIWTEPHSKRLKVKITVQKEVFNGAILQQTFVAEYTVEDHMCDACARVAANPDQWIAVVQVRQKVDHKRTFYFLEQLILKDGADANTVNIKQLHDGVDFYYGNRSHALKLIDFLNGVVPIQFRSDKQLVSQDSKSNTYLYKFTFSVEICPICKDDLICLPQKVAHGLGNIGPLVLCLRVSNNILLLDPNTLRTVYLDANQFWRYPFKRLLSSKQLVEYIILDIEESDQRNVDYGRGGSKKLNLVDAQVVRVSDFGKNDTMFTVRTHLGNLLNVGDYALGYDLYGANVNDDELDKYKSLQLPDVVLVRKSYEEKRKKKRGKPRAWKLKKLDMETESVAGRSVEDRDRSDYEKFLEEVEEDPEMRSKIALYKDSNYISKPADSDTMTEGDEIPEIPLEELLEDLTLDASLRRVRGQGGGEEEDAEDMDM